MKVLPRTEFGNPILRKKAKPVPAPYLKSKTFKALVKSMIYTMRRVGGVGLAAPQIGVPLRLAVMELHPTGTRPTLKKKGPLVIVNPKITKYSKEKSADWEGCLSFKNARGKVMRPKSITVTYFDEKGKKHAEVATGLWARIFQHEIDHLNGTVYVDRMSGMQTLMTVPEFRKRMLKPAR